MANRHTLFFAVVMFSQYATCAMFKWQPLGSASQLPALVDVVWRDGATHEC